MPTIMEEQAILEQEGRKQQTFTLQKDKLFEAVLYLAERSLDDPNLGIIKLTKLLYFADVAAYQKRGEPITGATYLHFPHGPHPKNWHKLRQEMESVGDIDVLHGHGPGSHRYRVLPKRPARLETLSSDDCAILDEQLEKFTSFNTSGIEEHSQYGLGWLATEDGEPIPWEMSGMTDPPASVNDTMRRMRFAATLPRR